MPLSYYEQGARMKCEEISTAFELKSKKKNKTLASVEYLKILRTKKEEEPEVKVEGEQKKTNRRVASAAPATSRKKEKVEATVENTNLPEFLIEPAGVLMKIQALFTETVYRMDVESMAEYKAGITSLAGILVDVEGTDKNNTYVALLAWIKKEEEEGRSVSEMKIAGMVCCLPVLANIASHSMTASSLPDDLVSILNYNQSRHEYKLAQLNKKWGEGLARTALFCIHGFLEVSDEEACTA